MRIVAIILGLITACAGAIHAELEIAGNILRYKGKTLRFLDRAQLWFAALGKPSGSRENGSSMVYTWDSLGLELYATHTPDNRDYASLLTIKLARTPVSIFGIPLAPPVRLREIQRALAPKAALVDHPGSTLATVDMSLRSPDGFPVYLSAPVQCDPNGPSPEPIRYRGHIPLPRRSKGDECLYVFDEITLSASGYHRWN